MTQVHIVNRIQTDFGMVPRALWQMELPANAKLCAAYLFCLRDGSAPYVAQIERETGLGRDARRKAFAALEALGIIRWVIERDAARRIVAKSLVVDYSPVLAFAQSAHAQQVEGHAPEIPADGKPVPVGAETRPCGDGKSGDPCRKENKTARRRAARPSERPAATGAQVRRAAASRAQASASGSAGDSRLNGNRREYLGPDGVWYPEPRDYDEAERFHQWRQARRSAPALAQGEAVRHG